MRELEFEIRKVILSQIDKHRKDSILEWAFYNDLSTSVVDTVSKWIDEDAEDRALEAKEEYPE